MVSAQRSPKPADLPRVAPAGQAPEPVRFDFLDGIRALAAWYVVFHHAVLELWFCPSGAELGPLIDRHKGWVFLERHAVGTFIVLSGYCLMMPVVSTPSWALRGGYLKFMWRRAKRIVPAYYAAIGLSLLFIVLVPGMRDPSGIRWDMSSGQIGWADILSHLAFVQTLKDAWAFKIDYPLWTVATEWQIYLVFPLLIWVFKRLGWAPLLTAAVGVPWLVTFTWGYVPSNASLWYMALFALGMIAASLGTGPEQLPRVGFIARNLGVVVCIYLLNQVRAGEVGQPVGPRDSVLNELVIGVMAVLLIMHCRVETELGERGPLTWFFGSKPMVALGRASFSLYVIHAPLVAAIHLTLIHFHLTATRQAAAMLVFGMPLIGACAWAFASVFERTAWHSTPTRRPSAVPVAAVEIVSS